MKEIVLVLFCIINLQQCQSGSLDSNNTCVCLFAEMVTRKTAVSHLEGFALPVAGMTSQILILTELPKSFEQGFGENKCGLCACVHGSWIFVHFVLKVNVHGLPTHLHA